MYAGRAASFHSIHDSPFGSDLAKRKTGQVVPLHEAIFFVEYRGIVRTDFCLDLNLPSHGKHDLGKTLFLPERAQKRVKGRRD